MRFDDLVGTWTAHETTEFIKDALGYVPQEELIPLICERFYDAEWREELIAQLEDYENQ